MSSFGNSKSNILVTMEKITEVNHDREKSWGTISGSLDPGVNKDRIIDAGERAAKYEEHVIKKRKSTIG